MAELKHVGRIKATGRKVLVVFRTLPGESDSALVVQTENLTDAQHDSIIRVVESPAGQSAHEFAEVLARSNFPDGSTMLSFLHVNGKLSKVKTSDVEMTPSLHTSISLDELNQLIAQQRGISVNDLAIANQAPTAEIQHEAAIYDISDKLTPELAAELEVAQPLSDEDLAKKYRSDADRLSKEAAQLRRLAEELIPIQKKIPEVVKPEVKVATKVATKKPSTSKTTLKK
jgi:hypothetical protein